MSERKVLNKYYPPDFDPSKIPRMKLPKNRQYTVRLMAPFNMRCKTCGEYIYKGKKFNARKEDVENEDYYGIRIYRFYIKCTRCLQEISFKTDPKNTDYEIEAGATRNFMALKLAEEQALREEEEAREEEANNPMKLLENRTKQSKNEIELLESLEELKDLNRRQQAVDYDTMLLAYDTRLSEKEREEKLKQLDEEYIKTIKFQSGQKRKIVVEEEIIEECEPDKIPRVDCTNNVTKETASAEVKSTEESNIHKEKPSTSTAKSSNNWNKSVGGFSKKLGLSGLVKIKSKSNNSEQQKISGSAVPLNSSNTQNSVSCSESKASETASSSKTTSKVESTQSSGLSLLGAYSDSDNSEND